MFNVAFLACSINLEIYAMHDLKKKPDFTWTTFVYIMKNAFHEIWKYVHK